MKLNELQIFSAKTFLISIVPSFLIYHFFSHKIALIFLMLMFLMSLFSFFNANFAGRLRKNLKQVGHVVGNFISYSILSIIFIFVVIPTKFVMLLTKRDRLRRRKNSKETYWLKYDANNKDYELQY